MNPEKPQICIIHGGETFDSDDDYLENLQNKQIVYERLLYSPAWKNWLAEQLADYDVLTPSMPNRQNAKYEEWALYFSKIVPFLRPDATLIGHSLGGIFLAKYFSQHPPEKPYARLILLAAPHSDESLESLGNFRIEDARSLANAANEIHLLHSEDDPVVPVTEADRYASDLPAAKVHKFTDRHHFIGPDFPELARIIHA